MNFDGSFRRIGSANIEPIKALVGAIEEEEWDQENVRQQRYEVHKDTQTIPLVHDYDFRHTNPTRHPALERFGPIIRPILAITADFYDSSEKGRALTARHGIGYFVRANLVRLAPGGTIDEHCDGNFSLTHSHRVHVPIVTNDRVLFKVGQETLSIPEGEIYEINNRRPHSVHNAGDSARVHLILDYVLKGEKCCCGEKHHPDQPCTPDACMDTVRGRIPCTCYPENG
jgi:quercetin dioxygenase-like cupin family protein